MCSCWELVKILKDRGFVPKRSLGQNFLVDDNIRNFILDQADVDNRNVLEIGAGNGALTVLLVKKARKLLAFEIDKILCEHLRRIIKQDNFVLVCKDALKEDWNSYGILPAVLVSNLPYNISSPFFFKLWDEDYDVPHFVVMVQLEVAKRLVSREKSKDYGILSVLYALTHELRIVKRVSRRSFWPQPEVDSAILKGVRLNFLEKDVKKMLKVLLNIAFRYRRKKLYKAFSIEIPEVDWRGLLAEVGIDPDIRPDALSPDGWFYLAKLGLSKLKHKISEV